MTDNEIDASESPFVGLVTEGRKFRLIVEVGNFKWQRASVTGTTMERAGLLAGAAMRAAEVQVMPSHFFMPDKLSPYEQGLLASILDAAMHRGYRQGRA
ncbi:hypothetical protein [Cupriavidus metallidurans]|uniref:hypothetical protein n=1 Tax=Cupriavidus metallidurans TaxID=119219 RepID=UPI0016474502|nr:hypothetical protein [Cupriavidus metallidurans]